MTAVVALLASAFWPGVLLTIATLGYRAVHRYMGMISITTEHLDALSKLTALHVGLQNKLSLVEMQLHDRVKSVEDKVNRDTSFRAVAGMLAPKK